MKDRTVERVISTCVDRYLSGEWTLDDCLARYPEHADLVRNYLELSDSLADLTPPPPSQAALSFGERLVLGELDQLVESRRVPFELARACRQVRTAAGRVPPGYGDGGRSPGIGVGQRRDARGLGKQPHQPPLRIQARSGPGPNRAGARRPQGRRVHRRRRPSAARDGARGAVSGRPRNRPHFGSATNKCSITGCRNSRSLSQADAAHVRQRFTESRYNFHIRLEGHRRRLELMAPSGPAGGSRNSHRRTQEYRDSYLQDPHRSSGGPFARGKYTCTGGDSAARSRNGDSHGHLGAYATAHGHAVERRNRWRRR